MIIEYTDYDSFAREWHSGTLGDHDVSLTEARERRLLNEQQTRHLWQLLGLLDAEECLVQLPEWLAEKKMESADRTTPTIFVGQIATETEDAILFEASAAARPLMGVAHKMHSLQKGMERIADDTDRYERLTDRFREHEQRFNDRDTLPTLSEEWLPKSQIGTAVRRSG